MGFRSAKKVVCVSGVAFVFLLTASVPAPAAPLPRPATVGLFAERLARQLGFHPANAPEARALLAGAGVTFEAGLDEPLTEDRAAGLLSNLGLSGTSSGDPSRMLTSSMVERLAGLAAQGILAHGGVPPPRPEGSLPNSCQTLERSLCFQCCVASLAPISIVPQRAIDLCNSSCTLMGAPPSSPGGP